MKVWNAMLVGIGGQGVITLKRILEYAALKEKKIKKMIGAEKHGLAQREGSVDVYVRFLLAEDYEQVPEYYLTSPTIGIGEADLVIGLEPVEVLRNAKYTNKNTVFIINTYTIAPPACISGLFDYCSIQEIENAIKDISSSSKIIIINATEISMTRMKDPIYTNNIMLGAAISTGNIPISKKNIETTILQQMTDVEKNIEALNIGIKVGLEKLSELK